MKPEDERIKEARKQQGDIKRTLTNKETPEPRGRYGRQIDGDVDNTV
ncbi:hypothetical protein [Peribacillus sp. SCS-155]